MVTPRKEYSESQTVKLLGNAIGLSKVYLRDPNLGIRLAIRYDPDIGRICLHEPSLMKYNYGGYFLLWLHYKSLRYSMKCLGWNVELAYEEFIETLNGLLMTADLNIPHVMYITVYRDGTIKANVENASSVNTMFDGFIEQFHAATAMAEKNVEKNAEESYVDEYPEVFDSGDTLLEDESDTESGPSVQTSKPSLLLYIDSDPTLPSYNTTLETTNLSQYIEAHKRVSFQHLKNQKEKNRSKAARNNVIDSLIEVQVDENAKWNTLHENLEDSEDEGKDFALHAIGDDITPLMYNTVHQLMSAGHEWCIAIFRDGKWLTPHLGAGARNDPLRMLLLELRLIEEAFLLLQGLYPYEEVLLISASHGISHGCVIGEMPTILYKYTRSRVKQKENEKDGKAKDKQKTKFRLSPWMNIPYGYNV